MLFPEFHKYTCMRIPLLLENTQVLKGHNVFNPISYGSEKNRIKHMPNVKK